MKMKTSLLSLVLPILLAVGTPLSAQSLEYGMKFGAGATAGSIGSQARRGSLSTAIFADWKFGPSSSFFGEFTYQYFLAADHEVTQFGSGYSVNGNLGTLSPATSVDVRQDRLEGYGVNLGYRQKLGSTAWSWHAGLSLNIFKSTQEVTGQLLAVNAIDDAAVGGSANRQRYTEGLNYRPSKTDLKPGAFVGIRTEITRNAFVEFNANFLGYSQINYLPKAYTGQAPATETSSKNKVVTGVSVGFKF